MDFLTTTGMAPPATEVARITRESGFSLDGGTSVDVEQESRDRVYVSVNAETQLSPPSMCR